MTVVRPEYRNLSAAKRGYDAKWRARRQKHLALHPWCALCLRAGRKSPASVVDHIVPARLGQALESGDKGAIAAARALFFSNSNLQSLCKSCHDRIKQRIEKSGVETGWDTNGNPLDPGHHWNTS